MATLRPKSPGSVKSKGATTELVEDAPLHDPYLEQWPLLREKSPEELAALDKAVVKKLDWRFLPCMTAMLLMNYLDRINVSNARLAGMQRDLNMTDEQWSTGISMFYVGYIISQLPANIILAKGNPRILMPVCMLSWSAVTICMPALRSGWAFIFTRFLAGLTEGPFIPAVSLLTSSWYTKNETPLRMGIWHAGNVISNIVSSMLAAAILTNMNGIGNLSAWQWFLLIEGVVSILIALISFWLIPKWPSNTGTYFFTTEESEMAQYRQQVSTGGVCEDDEGGYWSGLALAVKDPFTWMFALLHFAIIIGQSFKDFFPSIVDTFGFSKIGTYLLQAPPYLFGYIFTLVIAWSSGRMLEYTWHIAGSMAMTLVGAIILISTLETGPRFFGLFLLCSGPFAALNLHISWETTVLPRPRTKRAAVVAIANAASSISHWFTPYFYLTSQEPRYETGGGCIMAGCGLSIIMCFVIKWWCTRKNKALKTREIETGEAVNWWFVS
ncbi:major facilitator superfamily transporter [Hypoxylon trugodes]|uniref:major facilitator superfamily transporter n=1 Tax=Hypoxylon trugodes TaxID=326681 RepID=UPI00218D9E44|nr:major facilitator superfamily transporter [Hypoxylon trugodes]KAI1393108.1 major facilitator superfamily transporter [Hypoxylon trugodes]